MTLNAASPIVRHFWRSMGERFGRRWLDEYGDQPTRAWADELAPYAADTIRAALDLMGDRGWVHPPTLPQFQQLLRDADRRAESGRADHVRGYWRTLIVREASRALDLSPAEFERYLAARRGSLGVELRDLLNDADGREKARNERTGAMVRHVEERARALALASLRGEGAAA